MATNKKKKNYKNQAYRNRTASSNQITQFKENSPIASLTSTPQCLYLRQNPEPQGHQGEIFLALFSAMALWRLQHYGPLFTNILTSGLTCKLGNQLDDWLKSTSPDNHPAGYIILLLSREF